MAESRTTRKTEASDSLACFNETRDLRAAQNPVVLKTHHVELEGA